jgi:excinuclease ABC subunit C
MSRDTRRKSLVARIGREVPRRPGVYSFLDRHGAVLYIGKSIDLRRRMSSYFTRYGPRAGGRLRRLVFSTHDFRIQETRSELLALLLEDRLIKRHCPLFNKRLKDFERYRYLRLSGPPYPALLESDASSCRECPDAFGPFPDGSFLEMIRETVCSVLNLRSCTDPEPTGRCIRSATGSCRGPCRTPITAEDYGRIVSRVTEYLDGDGGHVFRLLTRRMERSAEALEYERAAQLKELLDFNRRFCERQRFIRHFTTGKLFIREENPRTSPHVFVEGRLQVPDAESPDVDVKRAIAAVRPGSGNPSEDDRFVHDRAVIVFGWINRNRETVDIALE